ncbi:MAG TPA: CPBP family glutamic-type intramembrane protease [Thermomicrobiaceae bacterium]|nr:CPBP family glutamic-type intramembrane protease [Thermomicrobiaceae bacterium]
MTDVAHEQAQATTASRVTWRDALITAALLAAGIQVIPRAVLPYAVAHNLAWLPAYAAHAWLLVVPIYWMAVLERGFPLGRIGRAMLRPWAIAWGVLGVVALAVGVGLAVTGQPVAVGDNVTPDVMTIVMLLLFQGVLVAVSEEFAFRGLVQTGLNSGLRFGFVLGSWEFRLGTMVTAMLVALLRSFPVTTQSNVVTVVEVVVAFVTSFIAGQLYDQTDNLWGAVILHGIYDLAFVVPLVVSLH